MRVLGLVLFACMLSLTSFGQNMRPHFAKSINPGAGGYVQDSHFDIYGNYYIAGVYGTGNDFNPISGQTYQLTTYDGSYGDLFLAKYDPSGYLYWAVAFSNDYGYTGVEAIHKITTDNSGNIYVAGFFASYVINLDPSSPQAEERLNYDGLSGYEDGFVVKLDANASFQWAYHEQFPYTNNFTGITVDEFGDVFATGNAYLAASGTNSIFIRRIDGTTGGLEHNILEAAGDNEQQGGDIFIQGDNLVVTGSFRGNMDLDPFNITSGDELSAGSYYDVFLAAYNRNTGQFTGLSRKLGGDYDDVVSDAEINNFGELVLTGYFESPYLYHDAGYLTNNGTFTADFFVAKYNLAFGLNWAHGFGASEADYSTALDVTSNGGVYLTGTYRGLVDFDPSGGTYQWSSYDVEDAFVLRLSANGELERIFGIGNYGFDIGDEIAVDPHNNPVLAGQFASVGSIDFDPGSGSLYLSETPYALVKYAEVPEILSISPTYGTPGSQVTISGTNFGQDVNTNTVFFGEVKAEILSANPYEIVARVPLGPTLADVSVTARNLTAYSPVQFKTTFETNGILSASAFAARESYATGASPWSIDAADMDNDGKPDLIVPHYTSPNPSTIGLFRNISVVGNPQFESRYDLTTLWNPASVTTADFNGDGSLDMVYGNINYSDYPFGVFQNYSSPGSFSFGRQDLYAPGGISGNVPAVADFNNDGRPDFAGCASGPIGFWVYKNISPPNYVAFEPAEFFGLPYVTGSEMRAEDVDGDGKVDLLVTQASYNIVAVYKNTSSGDDISFAYWYDIYTQTQPMFLTTGDVDDDGRPDVVISNVASNTVSVYLNTSSPGSVSFGSHYAFATGAAPTEVDLGDVDGDGKIDIVVANQSGASVYVLKNESSVGSPYFYTVYGYAAGPAPQGVVIADLDGDRKPEIAFNNNQEYTISILHNLLTSPAPVVADFTPKRQLAGEIVTIAGQYFSSDPASNIVYFGAARAEVVGGSTTELNVVVPSGATHDPISVSVNGLTGYSHQMFTKKFSFNGAIDASFSYDLEFSAGDGKQARRNAVGDIDGDGKPDIVVASPTNGSGVSSLITYRNISDPGSITDQSFFRYDHELPGFIPYAVAVGDVNGDTKPDVVVANLDDFNKVISVFTNTSNVGSVQYGTVTHYNLGYTPTNVTIRDLDLDGKPEIIASTYSGSSGGIAILRNTNLTPGVTSFLDPALEIGGASYAWGIAAGDIDGDGRPEVLSTNASVGGGQAYLSVFYNTTSPGTLNAGTFTRYDYAVPGSPFSVALSDLDGEGRLDIIVGNTAGNPIRIHRNESTPGTFTFQNNVVDLPVPDAWNVLIADVDGDGRPDVVSNSVSASNVSIFKNTTSPGNVLDANSFSTTFTIPVGNGPLNASAVDLDADGRTDLVVSDENANVVSVLKNLNASYEPSSQPYDLAFSEVTSHSLIGTFTAPAPAPDGYIVIRKAGETPATEEPQDGVAYPVGTILADGSIVVYSGNRPRFNASGLDDNNAQSFSVYAFNGAYNAVNYNTLNPATATVYMGAGTSFHDVHFNGAAAISGALMEGVGEITTAKDGSIYLTGYIDGTTDFNPDLGSQSLIEKVDCCADVYVAKYGPAGALQWAKTLQSSSGYAEIGEGIATDDAGNVYVTGRFNGTVNFDPGITNFALGTDGGFDIFVAKYSAAGVFNWAVKFGSAYNDTDYLRNGFDVDGDGNVVIAGEFEGSIAFNGNGLVTAHGSADAFVAKLYNDGSLNWFRRAGGSDYDVARDATIDPAGNVFYILQTNSPELQMDGTANVVVSKGNTDAVFIKYDAFGNIQWAKTIGGPNAEYGESIVADRDGSLYVSGTYSSHADFDPSDDFSFLVSAAGAADETFIARYTNDGELLWARSFYSGNAAYGGARVETDGIGNAWVYGIFQSSINADPNGGTYYLNGNGGWDHVLFKVSSDGFLRWAGSIGGSDHDYASDLAIAPNRDVIIAGAFQYDVYVDPADPSKTLTAAGQEDVVFVRFGATPGGFSSIPSISGFSPQSGDIGTYVTITGSNFDTDASKNIVYFGDTRAVVSSASETELYVSVPVGASYDEISVTRSGFTAYSHRPFVVTYPASEELSSSSFSKVGDYATLTAPSEMASGDFNGDQLVDIVVTNESVDEMVTVFLNTTESGNTSFTSSFNLPVGTVPDDVAIGDLDGDGRLDLVVAGGNNFFSVFRNSGAAQPFSTRVDIQTNTWFGNVAVADIDLDGRQDIVLTSPGNNGLLIYRNISSPGSLTAGAFIKVLDIITGTNPGGLAIANLDGDSRPEIIVPSFDTNTISIYTNNTTPGVIASENFSRFDVTDIAAFAGPVSISAGDLDMDGDMDIVSADHNNTSFNVLRNQGGSNYSKFTTAGPGGASALLHTAIADMNGDGVPDIITPTHGVYLNQSSTGDFDYLLVSNFLSNAEWDVDVNDFNGDGRPDVAVVNRNAALVSVYLNNMVLSNPTVQSSQINTYDATSGSISFNFTAGNGNKHMVVMKENGVVDQGPTDGSIYTADFSYSGGHEISGGNFMVGTLEKDWTSATITGLNPATQYSVAIMDYNDVIGYTGSSTSNSKYLTTLDPSNGNPVSFYTLALEPGTHSVSLNSLGRTGFSITLGFQAASALGNAAGYVLLRSTTGFPTTSGVEDGGVDLSTTLPAGTVVAGMITDPNAVSYSDNALDPNTTYYYSLVPFNWAPDVNETLNFKVDGSIPSVSETTMNNVQEPTAIASNFNYFDQTATSYTISFEPVTSEPVTGYLVVRKSMGTFNGNPVDGVAYEVGNDLSPGDNEIVVFNGPATSNPFYIPQTGLGPDQTFHYRIYSYNGTGEYTMYFDSNYLIGSAFTLPLTAPTTPASNIDLSNRLSTSVDFSFTPGNGAYHLVVVRENLGIDQNPAEGEIFTADFNYFNRDALNAGGDHYAVGMLSTETSAQITNLSPGTFYSLGVFEYNDVNPPANTTTASARYLTSLNPANGNPVGFYTLASEPSNHPATFSSTEVTGGSVRLSFSAANTISNASGYVILRSTTNYPAADGIYDGGFSEGSIPGHVSVVTMITDPAQTEYEDSGLTGNTSYLYAIIPFGWLPSIDATLNFKTDGTLRTYNATTLALAAQPTDAPDNWNVDQQTSSGFRITFTTAVDNPDGYIVIRKQGDDQRPENPPIDGRTYSVGSETVVGSGEYVVYFQSPGSNPVEIFEGGMPPNTIYEYAVYSYNGSGSSTNYLTSERLIGEGRTITDDTQAPAIGSDNTLPNVPLNESINISVTITDPSGVQQANVFYRSISGANEFTPQSLSQNGQTWTTTLSADKVGELGIEYYIHAVDFFSNATAEPSVKKKVTVQITDSEGLVLPNILFGGTQQHYKIISIPLASSNMTVASIFGDDLGTYDDSKYRVFHYSGGNTNEVRSGSISPGKGYWLIIKDNPGQPIGTGPGATVPATRDNPFSIQLNSGWNQIGNPYNFNLKWSDIMEENPGLPGVIRLYQTGNGNFIDGDRINKFEGGFVFVQSAMTLRFPVEKNNAVNGRTASDEDGRLKNPIDHSDWEIGLTVKQGFLTNLVSGFGMRSDASEDFDPYDGFTLPRFLDYLELNHSRSFNGYSYSKDVVPTSDSRIWEFTVESSLSQDPSITITWDNTYFGNNEKSLILWDVKQQLAVNMREHNQYTFDRNASGNFRVIYGSQEFLRENTRVNGLVFHHIQPNPVSDEAIFSFSVPHAGNVTIEVTDVTGKSTGVVFDGMLDKGYHEVVFDSRLHNGASGVYIAQIKAGKAVAQQRMILK